MSASDKEKYKLKKLITIEKLTSLELKLSMLNTLVL